MDAHRISAADVADLLRETFPRGCLTVQVSLSPAERHDPAHWLAAVRSGLRDLAHSRPEEKHLAKLVPTALAEIEQLPVEARHRSLVWYRALEPDWTWWRSFQLQIPDFFAYEPSPQVRHLVALLDEAPVLGIAVVSQERTRILTWHQGSIEETVPILLEEPAAAGAAAGRAGGGAGASGSGAGRPDSVGVGDTERAESAGRADTSASGGDADTAGPSPEPQRISQRRAADQVRRHLSRLGGRIGEVAADLGWQQLLLIGPSSATGPAMTDLPDAWKRRVIGTVERNLLNAPRAEIAGAAEAALSAWKRREEISEVESVIDDANSGGRASIGFEPCLADLHERRVERLYLCGDLQQSGFRDDSGRFYLHAPRLGSGESVKPERRLVEAMVVAALDSGATVVPLEGESARRLRLMGGVGARLRWKDAGAPGRG